MTSPWVSVAKLCELTGTSRRSLCRRGVSEKWTYRQEPVRGGRRALYRLLDLPEDIQAAFARHEGITLEKLRNRLKPASKGDKTMVLPRYLGRGARVPRPAPLEQIPEEYLRIAALRQQVVMARERSGLSVADFAVAYAAGVAVPELRDQLGGYGHITSAQSLYRWLGAYERYGLAGLAPKYPLKRGGSGATMGDDEKELVRALYLDNNKPSVTAVHRDLAQFLSEGRTISYHTVYRYIRNEIPQAVKTYYRDGEKAYHDNFDPHIKRDYTLFGSMDWGNGDHHNFDFVVRHKGRLMRPWLTAFADLRSRMITGWHIDAIPSTLTVLRALDATLRDYGPFKRLILDNGKDMRSRWLAGSSWKARTVKDDSGFWDLAAGVAGECGMEIHFAKPYRGQSKPIERWFGTVCEQFSKKMPTYVGSNTTMRPDEAKLYWGRINGREKVPVSLTIKDVRGAFGEFVAWFNESWQHSGHGMGGKTPVQVYRENLHERRVMPETFRRYVMTRRERRTVQRSGVTIDGVEYYAKEMVEHIGQEVEVRRSLDDVGAVSIWKLPERTFLYYADNEVLKDRGVSEENNRRVQAIAKGQRAVIRKAAEARTALLQDYRTPAQRLAASAGDGGSVAAGADAYPEDQELQVVNGGPMLPDERGDAAGGDVIEFPRPAGERVKRRALKGLLDPD